MGVQRSVWERIARPGSWWTRPERVAAVGACVPLQEPWRGFNLGRALSLVPDQNLVFMSLVMQMYGGRNDFYELVWEDGPERAFR